MTSEKIYECEVKRTRRTAAGDERFWKVKTVADALIDADSDFRCKDCHGRVKLFGKHVAHGPAPHVEHFLRQDSEYCIAGMYFRRAKDGRKPKRSEEPVE